jgi:type II secretory pathway pseudopilin PulG
MNIASWIWVLIPLGVFAAGVAKRWLQFKERQLELSSTQAAEKAAQYAAKTERLEQRVAVLERILTDRSHSLGEEIERLRDAPLN